jgi:hypothetical protein
MYYLRLQINWVFLQKEISYIKVRNRCHANQSKEEVKKKLSSPQTQRVKKKLKTKLHGRSPQANYTDRATAACRRSYCQLVRKEGATWSA